MAFLPLLAKKLVLFCALIIKKVKILQILLVMILLVTELLVVQFGWQSYL